MRVYVRMYMQKSAKSIWIFYLIIYKATTKRQQRQNNTKRKTKIIKKKKKTANKLNKRKTNQKE